MNDVKANDNERVPYQLPMPKEALSEIVVPDALAKEDDRMWVQHCLLYTSPSPRDGLLSRMPSSA